MLSADTLAVLPLNRLGFLPLSGALLTKAANSPRPSLFLAAPELPLPSSLHSRYLHMTGLTGLATEGG